MQQSQAIAQKLAEIRPRFLAVLSQRLDRFEEIRDLLDTADITPLLEELRAGAHSTVGLAATLGFGDLGALAQKVELHANSILQTGNPTASLPEFLACFDDLLGEMSLVVLELE